MTTLGETLAGVMRRAGVGARTLGKLTGIPRTAIDNWREGLVRRPRHWRPLIQIATVLSLSKEETGALLASAGYPVVEALAGELPADHPDRRLLDPWLAQPDLPRRGGLRAPAPDFVGRDLALKVLLAALCRSDAAAAITGIRGMGGIGKTELALMAGNQVRDRFSDAQLMVNLRGTSATPLPAAQALRQVIHAFAPGTRLGDDLDSLQQQYCAALSGRRVLILADDADDAAQVRPLLPPPGCALLVTSRKRFTLPGMATVDLEQLTEPEAVAMLETICDRLGLDEARLIAGACGYLPLALRIGGSVLHNDPALPVDDFVAALADRRRLGRLRDPDDPQLDVAASLALTYQRLDATARSVFGRLGVLVADFAADLAEAVVAAPAGTDVDAVLRLLLRHNLIGYDPGGARWRLHDLVRDLACDYLEAAGERAATMWRYAEAAVRSAAAIHEEYLASGAVLAALAGLEAVRPHLDAGRDWATAHTGGEQGDRLLVAESVATQYVGFLRYDLRRELAPQGEVALAAARRLGDRRGEGIVLNRLGRIHFDLGEVDRAAGFHEEQLALTRDCDDQAGQARALNNLAGVYVHLGRPRAAIDLHEEQLSLLRVLGQRRGEAIALGNLGRALVFVGAGEQALTYLTRARDMALESGDRHGEAVVTANIGYAYLVSGDAQRSVEHLSRALPLARAMGDRHMEADVLLDLAQAQTAAGLAAQGIEQAGRALGIAEEIGARQAQAHAWKALGQGYAATGEAVKAVAAFETALSILDATGDPHGGAECRWRLGLVLVAADRPRALALMRSAVAYEHGIGHARAAEHAAFLERWDAEPPG